MRRAKRATPDRLLGRSQGDAAWARFSPTTKLIKLAEHYGIHRDNFSDHFKLDLPANPLVLRDSAVGRGANRERGPIIKNYARTEHTKRLEADNEFLARFDITGTAHYGYTRNLNLAAWDKGGVTHTSPGESFSEGGR